MRAQLIYNPNAGGVGQIAEADLVAGLKEAGFHPVYSTTGGEEDLDSVLADADGLVVAAGGDGTVRSVASRLIGKGVPLAILPAGTANNIWRTFSIPASPMEVIRGLKDPVKRCFDVGQVRFPWGEDIFLEAFGHGLYADILQFYEPEKGKSVIRSIAALIRALSSQQAHHCRISLDGQDISGDYLLFEVLNTPAIGPRIKLAPEADPGDGQFEVVRIREDNRDSLLAYLSGLLGEELEELPSVEVSRGSHLELVCEEAFPFHVDAVIQPKARQYPADQGPAQDGTGGSPEMDGPVLVDVIHCALELWLPKVEEAAGPASVTELTVPNSTRIENG